jgi:alpha-tubulin suppressor-like RCC1 family protein
MAIDSFGQIHVCGDNQFRQLGLPHTDKVFELIKLQEFPYKSVKASAGVDHSMILTEEDKIFACGNNIEGNLGLGHTYSSDSFL